MLSKAVPETGLTGAKAVISTRPKVLLLTLPRPAARAGTCERVLYLSPTLFQGRERALRRQAAMRGNGGDMNAPVVAVVP